LAVIDKRGLSERDICTKFITPALRQAGWDEMAQIREEVTFTKGRIIVRGKLVARGKAKRADYILYCKPNIPVAVIEAKDHSHGVGDGMQQALDYAETLRVPFAFSSNGDAFVFHDCTGASSPREADLALSAQSCNVPFLQSTDVPFTREPPPASRAPRSGRNPHSAAAPSP